MDDRQREQLNEERDQMVQRYVAGKVLGGASAKEIADGMTDPVEVMGYVPGSGSSNSKSGKPQSLTSSNNQSKTATSPPNAAEPSQALRWTFWLTVAIAIGLLCAVK